MPETPRQWPSLTDGAKRLIDTVLDNVSRDRTKAPGLNQWLLGCAEREADLLGHLAGGLAVQELMDSLRERLDRGNEGPALDPGLLIQRALELAGKRGDARAAERDVVSVVLTEAGFSLWEVEPAAVSGAPAAVPDAGKAPAPEERGTGRAGTAYRPRASKPTPTLDRLGWDLTRAAVEGKLAPVVGREQETSLIIETLCRRTKRNPALIGPAGVGKTAIVEGFAQLIAAGRVPDVLQGTRLISLPVSALIMDTGVVGQLEERMKTVVSEASQDGIVLFIDEMHTLKGAGAGSANPAGDVANQLKPALARGDIACIAATTDEEYRSFIERDPALERRFQPVRVQELGPAETVDVLRALRDDLARDRGVTVPDGVLVWLVDFADRFLKNRFFPDKAVDCLEQCVAHGVARGVKTVDLGDAETVAKRMVGMPIAPAERLERMGRTLRESGLLADADVEAFTARLEVTMRGFDFRQEHPNAVVLLTGEAEGRAADVAEVVAGSLYGAPDRVVDIDFGRFTEAYDVTMLVGAPPGYVGYSDSLPLHRVAEMPWCVLLCRNIHACHPQVREVITQALEQGFITESRGKRIYLSDAVVLFTTPPEEPEDGRRALGFAPGGGPGEVLSSGEPAAAPLSAEMRTLGLVVPGRGSGDHPLIRRSLERRLGRRFLAQIDFVFSNVPASDEARLAWLEQQLVAGLGERCRRRGLEVRFDRSLVEWLFEQRRVAVSAREWERLIEESVGSPLIPFMEDPARGGRPLLVRYDDGRVRVEPLAG